MMTEAEDAAGRESKFWGLSDLSMISQGLGRPRETLKRFSNGYPIG